MTTHDCVDCDLTDVPEDELWRGRCEPCVTRAVAAGTIPAPCDNCCDAVATVATVDPGGYATDLCDMCANSNAMYMAACDENIPFRYDGE